MFHHRLTFGLLAGCLLIVAGLTASVDAKTAVVYVKGRTEPIKGELVQETADSVILSIAGINTPIDKARIEKMEFEKSLAEQFKEKRAEIKDDDFEARYNLARWAFKKETPEAYRLAKTELDGLTQDAPDHQQARLLKTLVERRIAAAEAIEDNGGTTGNTTTTNNGQTTATDAQANDKPATLDKDQRALLKVYELNLTQKPRIVIPRKTIDQFLKDYRTASSVQPYNDRKGQARFRKLDGYEQLEIMFAAQARPLYKDVVVRDEPKALEAFRTKVNPRYVVSYFARQFGKTPVSGVNLITVAPNSEEAAYTNFLMLHRANQNGVKLIDRDRPDQSLLLQWGLPRDEATYPAPEDVKNWRPYFTGKDDERYVEMLQWVGSLYRPSPQYPIEYSPAAPEKAEDAE